jgi:hypothetical protein
VSPLDVLLWVLTICACVLIVGVTAAVIVALLIGATKPARADEKKVRP